MRDRLGAARRARRTAPRRRRPMACFAKARLERADDALEVRVVPAALGLDADRDEDVGVRVLGLQRTR